MSAVDEANRVVEERDDSELRIIIEVLNLAGTSGEVSENKTQAIIKAIREHQARMGKINPNQKYLDFYSRGFMLPVKEFIKTYQLGITIPKGANAIRILRLLEMALDYKQKKLATKIKQDELTQLDKAGVSGVK